MHGGNKLTVGFRVAYPVEVRVDAWSGNLMLDVAGFGFLVAVAEGDIDKTATGIAKHQSPGSLTMRQRYS